MNGFTVLNTMNKSTDPLIICHITADLMKVMYKLDLADKFYVTEVKERIWDPDELREVNDVVGYEVHWAE
jgi:hypothetical protein